MSPYKAQHVDPEHVHGLVLDFVCQALWVLGEEHTDARTAGAQRLEQAAHKLADDLMGQPGSWWQDELPQACRDRLVGVMQPSDDREVVRECCGLILYDVVLATRRHSGDHEAIAEELAERARDWTTSFCGLLRGTRALQEPDDDERVRRRRARRGE